MSLNIILLHQQHTVVTKTNMPSTNPDSWLPVRVTVAGVGPAEDPGGSTPVAGTGATLPTTLPGSPPPLCTHTHGN